MKNYVNFEIAKLLKEIGFDVPTKMMIVKFDKDYIYDEDPNHQESHKKGEIRVYDIYNINSQNEDYAYSLPHLYNTQEWLRNQYNIHIEPIINKKQKQINIWNYKIINIETGTQINNIPNDNCETYNDAMIEAIKYACNIIKNMKNK